MVSRSWSMIYPYPSGILLIPAKLSVSAHLCMLIIRSNNSPNWTQDLLIFVDGLPFSKMPAGSFIFHSNPL